MGGGHQTALSHFGNSKTFSLHMFVNWKNFVNETFTARNRSFAKSAFSNEITLHQKNTCKGPFAPTMTKVYSLLLKLCTGDANRHHPTLQQSALGVYAQNQLLLQVRRAETYSETSQT